MTIKSLLYYFSSLLGLVALSGCAKSDDCALSFDQQKFEQAIVACEQRYALNSDVDSLTRWGESLGRMNQSSEIPNIIHKIDSQAHRALVYDVAAKYELQLNNLNVAQDYYQLAADGYRQNDMQSNLVKVLHKLYFISWQQSEHKKAIEFAGESLAVARSSASEKDEIVALNNLFTIFQEVGNLGPAQQALSLINTKLGDDQSSPRRINAYINQGLLHMDQKQYGLAAYSYDAALAIAKGSKNKDALRGLHLNIVESNLALGRMEKAKIHLEKAWSFARPDGSKRYALLFYQSQYHYLSGEHQLSYDRLLEALDTADLPEVWLWRMHYWAGQAAQRLDQHAAAIEFFTKSIEASEDLRENMSLSELKAHSIARRRQPYEALFIEHFQAGNALQAFTIAEQAKTRSFTDSFIQTSESAISTKTNGLSFEAASDRVESLQLYLQSMQATANGLIGNSNNVVNAIDEHHLVSFYLAQGRLFSLLIRNGEVKIIELDVDYETLETLIIEHRQQPDNEEILSKLGELLFPISVLPKAGEHLYVSPDTLLGTISVASLRVDSKFLIERNTISIVPSANSMISEDLQDQPTTDKRQFIILGDPLNNLPAANREVNAVSQLLHSDVFLGKSANLNNILASPTPDLLHIATHSGINHLGPWIQLADGEIPGSALLRENLNPRMAVLASCASAAGNENHIWGSLGGLFLAKGTQSVLAAFRSIEDEYAIELILEFYRQIENQSSSAEALAISQRKAINRNEPPGLWGAFVLLGNPLQIY